ncbi:OsmC family protein [Limosilactobacillus frumenti DSM 13145]|uniref:OsmC family protein n=1 Tax=Limosilactobacillus frumenti DSM 13145 TaxID=1423746 RepID=A0A0R1PBL1_9LACO|nr:OsmC family protein [Limosilactobacillus frumenti]KRL28020.1 OsmC family protein [Limosilactobacillus frumenti DSM 13145]MBA2913487.1 OsmC family protein [Limosilactobacillus frumenti]QFG73152.1 OsmC family protein [Limosilactobacillus frumenti]
MAVTVYKATVSSTDRPHKYIAHVRDFTMTFDEPRENGGLNEGMRPEEAILCSLGACEDIVAGTFSKAKKFKYTSLYLPLSWSKNDADENQISEIHMSAYFRTPNTKKEAKDFVEFMENTCPVRDNLANSVPIVTKSVKTE